jgi:hypothetical protein
VDLKKSRYGPSAFRIIAIPSIFKKGNPACDPNGG